MKIAAALLFILPCLFPISVVAAGDTGFETDHIALYQTNEELSARAPEVAVLAGYLKLIQGECAAYFAGAKAPESLQIVVAVKPGKKSRVWLISSTLPENDKTREALVRKLAAVPVISVKDGPVVFAICGKIAGGDGKFANQTGPPLPQEWKDAAQAAKTSLKMPDDLLQRVWPDSPSTPNSK